MDYRQFVEQEWARRIHSRANKSIGIAVLLWLFCWPALLWWVFGAAWGILPFVATVMCVLAVDASIGVLVGFVVSIVGLIAALRAINVARADERRLLGS